MSRRSKIELYDILDRVVSLYNAGSTIREIEAVLREDGFDVSREGIRKAVKSAREVAETYRESLNEAKVLLETVRDNPNTDVIEVTTSLMANKLFEFTKSIDGLEFSDPRDAFNAVQKLAESQVRVAKLRLSYRDGFEAAKSAVMQAIVTALDQHPELKAQLAEIVAGLKAKD